MRCVQPFQPTNKYQLNYILRSLRLKRLICVLIPTNRILFEYLIEFDCAFTRRCTDSGSFNDDSSWEYRHMRLVKVSYVHFFDG